MDNISNKKKFRNLKFSKLLNIFPDTVMSRIRFIAHVTYPPLMAIGKKYEVDEMGEYNRNKSRRRYIVYSLRRNTKEVVSFAVVCPQNTVINTLQLSNTNKIYSEGLREYKTIINSKVHIIKKN